MLEPEDLLQDEIEYPDQTRQLQRNYTPPFADQKSLQSIRTRLLAQRTAQMAEKTPKENLQAGQFIPFSQSSVTPPSGQRKKSPYHWHIVALVAVLCIAILSGTLFVMAAHPSILAGHPRTTPTTVPASTPVPPSNVDLSKIQMTSATVGWAIGTTISNGTFCIAHTTDGGKSWQTFDFNHQNPGLISYFFLDGQTAWVSLGTGMDGKTNLPMMHTTDGGQHWTKQSAPPSMSGITFVDRLHGWAWEPTPIPATPSLLYKTVDGGTTWINVGTTSADRALDDQTPGPLPYSTGLSLTFTTPLRGWATVSQSQSSQDYQQAHLYITQDGGITWQLQQLPQPASGPIPGIHTTMQSGAYLALSDPRFFTAQKGLLCITSQVDTQAPRKFYVYATSNGGQSWSPLGTDISNATSSDYFIGFIDATHITISNSSSFRFLRYALVDGQWQPQPSSTPATTQSFVIGVCFINDQLGWIIVNTPAANNRIITKLYVTNNNGKSWKMITQTTVTINSPQGG